MNHIKVAASEADAPHAVEVVMPKCSPTSRDSWACC